MAITTKARAKGLLRDARALLADKTLPKAVSDALEAVEAALKKNWADLAAEVEAEPPEAEPEPEQRAEPRSGNGSGGQHGGRCWPIAPCV